MGKSPTLLFLFLISISLLLISLVSKTTPPRPPKISHSTNLHNPFHPPPKIAYFISTSDGDGPRTVRLLSAFYHPSNRYLLHLDRRAAQAKRDDLAGVVGAVDAFTAAGNVNVFGNADPLNIEGPTAVAAVLRGAAVLMRRWKDWDWFDCTRCCHLSFVALRGLGLDRKGWLSFTCRAAARDGFEGGNLFSGGSFKGSENRSIFDGFDESGAASFGTLSAEITPETVDFFVSEAEGDPDCPSEGFSSIDQAIDALRQGKFVIAVDDENGDEEGDLIMAASLASSRALAFMIRHGSGIVSVGMKEEDLERLSLPLMSTGSENEDPSAAAYTVTVDLKTGASTGVSASDRAKTILALSSPDSKPQDFRRPGHVFPLKYRNGGVLRRAGHTEASVDLVSLAGLPPVSVLSAILDAEDGSMARLLALRKIAKENSIPIISITDLIRYRRKRERLVERTAVSGLPTKWGNFQAYCYLSKLDGTEHVAIVKGDIGHGQDVLVRVHSECLTGDIFGSARCDCGNQLALAMQLIEEAGRGVLVYLRGHEGRGIGLGHKLRAYNLQDLGHDTVEANLELGLAVDAREYGIGAQILRDIGVRTMRLMTNNPAKFIGLKGYGLAVVGRVPVLSPITEENWRYLETKRTKMGHVYGSDLPGSITGFGKPIVNNTDQAKEGQTD